MNHPDSGHRPPDSLNTMWPPQVAQAWVFHFFLVCIWLCILVNYISDLHGLFEDSGHIVGHDFINMWSGAKLALDGHVTDLFDIGRFYQAERHFVGPLFYQLHNWSYPPHLIPWITVIGLFSYPVALGLWTIGTFALYAFAVSYRRANPWVLTLILALAPASFENIVSGQNGFLTAAFLVGGLRLLHARPKLAGVLFGFLTFKPHLGLMVPLALLLGRHGKVIAAALLTALALAALALFLYGAEPWRGFFNVTVPFQRRLLELAPAFYLDMMPSPFAAARHLGAPTAVAYAISIAVALYAALLVAIASTSTIKPERRDAILLTAALLATPYSFSYDMTLLSAAVVSFLASSGGRPLPLWQTLFFALLWLSPLCVFGLNGAGVPLTPLVLLVFLVLQARELPRDAGFKISLAFLRPRNRTTPAPERNQAGA